MLLDLRGKSPVAEFFIIATGSSPRQMRTVVDEVKDLGKRMNFTAWKVDGYESAKWILVDCVAVVTHVFDPDSRDFYDLELLWGDCPRIDWRSILGLPPEVLADRVRPAAIEASDDEEFTDEFADEDDDQVDSSDEEGVDEEDEEAEAPVMLELPDESTGSNSVEFVEVESPSRRRKKGTMPRPIADRDEVPDELERISAQGESAEEIEDAVEELESERKRLSKRKAAAKPVKKKPSAVAKKAVKKAVSKKPAPKKKAPVKAVKKPAKKVVKKSPAKKAAAKKAPAKKVASKRSAVKKPTSKKPAGKKPVAKKKK